MEIIVIVIIGVIVISVFVLSYIAIQLNKKIDEVRQNTEWKTKKLELLINNLIQHEHEKSKRRMAG